MVLPHKLICPLQMHHELITHTTRKTAIGSTATRSALNMWCAWALVEKEASIRHL
jgi:hypothetical protein